MRIGTRLFIALSLASLLVLTINAFVARWNFQTGFLGYVEAQEVRRLESVAEQLAEIYERDRDWSALQNSPREWDRVLRDGNERRQPGPGPRGDRPPPPGGHGAPPPDPLTAGRPIGLETADGAVIIGPMTGEERRRVPIQVQNDTVGYVTLPPLRGLTAEADQQFAREQGRANLMITAFAVVLAAIIAAILARQLTRPIRELASGADAVSAGDYDHRVNESRTDELGGLARDFNRLSESLRESREARKRWVADIAHELRTPLSILRGELDAIADGVRSFDESTRASLLAEVDRLSTLVNDLHELSLSDRGDLEYRFTAVDLTALLKQQAEACERRLADAGIALELDIPTNKIDVAADAGRLEQLMANLVENSIRYTDSPGKLRVSCSVNDADVSIRFADSAPSVPEESLDLLFDRLYRVDASRNRESGGTGLGLSICKAIAEAHGGSIGAATSDLGGLEVLLVLPLASKDGSR